MNASIIISGLEATTLSATDEARTRRDELLARARKGTTINSTDSAARAAEVLKEVTNFTRFIEDGRKEAKAPFLEYGKKVDALALELTKDLTAEQARISRMLGTFQAEENLRAAEAMRKAYEEEQRIKEEAAAKERAAQEAARLKLEEERKAAEAIEAKKQEEARIAAQHLADKAARARSETGKAKAEEEAKALAEKQAQEAQERAAAQAKREIEAAEQAEREAQARADAERQKIIETRVATVGKIAPKPVGVATREEICYEVTDVQALYEAAPYLVKLEPIASMIKGALKQLQEGQNLPGVRHWRENRAIVR
jgi:hypothetical protein